VVDYHLQINYDLGTRKNIRPQGLVIPERPLRSPHTWKGCRARSVPITGALFVSWQKYI